MCLCGYDSCLHARATIVLVKFFLRVVLNIAESAKSCCLDYDVFWNQNTLHNLRVILKAYLSISVEK